MNSEIEALYKPVSALSESELAELRARIAEYKRTGAIIDLGPFDTRTFIEVNDETMRKVKEALGRA